MWSEDELYIRNLEATIAKLKSEVDRYKKERDNLHAENERLREVLNIARVEIEMLKEKIEDLSPEHGIYLYKAINLDKNEIGAVASNQIIG